jgi:hypothetical protein
MRFNRCKKLINEILDLSKGMELGMDEGIGDKLVKYFRGGDEGEYGREWIEKGGVSRVEGGILIDIEVLDCMPEGVRLIRLELVNRGYIVSKATPQWILVSGGDLVGVSRVVGKVIGSSKVGSRLYSQRSNKGVPGLFKTADLSKMKK